MVVKRSFLFKMQRYRIYYNTRDYNIKKNKNIAKNLEISFYLCTLKKVYLYTER